MKKLTKYFVRAVLAAYGVALGFVLYKLFTGG